MNSREEPQCIICMESLMGKEICGLPCGHCYHEQCVTSYLAFKTECPQCRTQLSRSDPSAIRKLFLFDIEDGIVKKVNEEYDRLSSEEKANVEKLQVKIRKVLQEKL